MRPYKLPVPFGSRELFSKPPFTPDGRHVYRQPCYF
nr:MAG TPA: hypothetical protein [Caudoviricetes sp.]